jgi:hypothetical protein
MAGRPMTAKAARRNKKIKARIIDCHRKLKRNRRRLAGSLPFIQPIHLAYRFSCARGMLTATGPCLRISYTFATLSFLLAAGVGRMDG